MMCDGDVMPGILHEYSYIEGSLCIIIREGQNTVLDDSIIRVNDEHISILNNITRNLQTTGDDNIITRFTYDRIF